MITHNTDSAFIQIKSVHTQYSASLNATVAEVIEMTTYLHNGPVKLDELLLIAVDETLKDIFKEEGVKAIYDFIEKNCCLKRDEIAEKPKDFSACLKKLLSSAAPVIEKAVLEGLFSEFGLEFVERESFGFADYVRELRERSCSAIE